MPPDSFSAFLIATLQRGFSAFFVDARDDKAVAPCRFVLSCAFRLVILAPQIWLGTAVSTVCTEIAAQRLRS